MIRRLLALSTIAALLAACASPSPPMLGSTRSDIRMGSQRYVVYHSDWRAEAVRVSAARPGDTRAMLARAKLAMERASGCAVRPGTLYGDAVLAEAMLDCPARRGAALDRRRVYTPPR